MLFAVRLKYTHLNGKQRQEKNYLRGTAMKKREKKMEKKSKNTNKREMSGKQQTQEQESEI